MAHDLHDGTHDVDAKKHKNHECPNKTKEAPQEAQHGVTASRRRTKREDNIKRRQLFKNVPKVSTELRGRKDSLSDQSWGRREKSAARTTKGSAASTLLVPERSHRVVGVFNGLVPSNLETRQECVETRTEYVQIRAEGVETRTERVETQAECEKTRKEYEETRVEGVKVWAEHVKAWAEYVKAREDQDRRPKEVTVTTCPTLVYLFYINIIRYNKSYRVRRDKPPVRGKKSIEIENDFPTQGSDVPSPIHEESNPKIKCERRLGYSASPDSVSRGGRNVDRKENKAEPKSKLQATIVEDRTVKHVEVPKEVVKEEGKTNTAKINEIKEGRKEELERKLQAAKEKSGITKHRETTETNKRGEDSVSAVERISEIGESTKKPRNKLHALKPRAMKQAKTVEETVRGGDRENIARRNTRKEKKVTDTYKAEEIDKGRAATKELDKGRAETREPRELPKAWKKLLNKISGNFQFSSNRLKAVLLEKKEAYYESIPCKKKHMNWEYAQKCMYECHMTRTCMNIRNIKLHAWNRYAIKYALLGDNVVCMMHDKTSMHIMKVPIVMWNSESNELKFFKEVVYAYAYMRCSKIYTSTKWFREYETQCPCVMKCNYNVESKNHIIIIHFYSKAKIQSSPQIKLWGGSSFRENRSETLTNLWKNLHSLLKLWYLGEKMAAASATNVDMEMAMVDENEINSSSQKRPTMAQVTISQKKAKGKLVFEPKRPPFWLGFQAMN